MLSEVVPTPSKCSMKSQRNVQRWNYICTESWSPVSSHKEAQKYNSRSIFIAKRGEVQNVIETLKELRSAFETVTPLITVPVGGNADTVRAVTPLSSLDQLEE